MFRREIRIFVDEKEELIAARTIVHGEGREEDEADGDGGDKCCIVGVVVWKRRPLEDDVARPIEHAHVASARYERIEDKIKEKGALNHFRDATIVGVDQF